MRNIVEFPVTKEEMLTYLDNLTRSTYMLWAQVGADHLPIGDLGGVIISELKDLVDKYY